MFERSNLLSISLIASIALTRALEKTTAGPQWECFHTQIGLETTQQGINKILKQDMYCTVLQQRTVLLQYTSNTMDYTKITQSSKQVSIQPHNRADSNPVCHLMCTELLSTLYSYIQISSLASTRWQSQRQKRVQFVLTIFYIHNTTR